MRFLLALSFMTSIPITLGRMMSDEEMGQSTRWFPAVGGVIGVLVSSLFVLSSYVLPPLVSGAIALIFWIAITRGLHLDGLADTFDGLGGGATRERALEIMKDSRIGTFGALAIGSVLILKFASLSSFGPRGFYWILLSPILARWAVVWSIFHFPPARKDGAGRVFVSSCRRLELSVASAFALVASTVLLGWIGMVVLGVTGVVAYFVGCWICRHLKGLTGDSYGCICEMIEALVLVFGAMLLQVRL